MKPRHSSFADSVARLETEFVDALLKAVRERALEALGDVLSPSSGILSALAATSAPSRTPSRFKERTPVRREGRPAVPPRARSRKTWAEQAADRAEEPFTDEAPAKDEAPFVITDPSIMLAEVAAFEEAPAPAPPRRPRRVRSVTSSHLVEVPPPPEAPVEEEPAAAAPPALRDGEEVARAVVGGGVVLRRKRG